MKKFYFMLLAMMVAFTVGAHNYSGKYLNVPGDWNSWNPSGVEFNAEGIATVECNVTKGQSFKIKLWTGSADSWRSNGQTIALDTDISLPSNNDANMKMPESGKVYVTFNYATNVMRVSKTDPNAEVPATYAVVGSFQSWKTEADKAEYKTPDASGLVQWVVTEYANGEGVKVVQNKANSITWIGINDANFTVPNGEFFTINTGDKNINLPATAEGQDVTFTYKVSDSTLKVEWTPAEVVDPEDPTPEWTVALLGDKFGWSVDATTYVTTDITDNCATFVVPAWEAGAFKIVVNGAWKSTGGELANGEWYSQIGNEYANMTLPESANGKEVTIVFAVDTNSISASWKAEQQGSDVDPEDPMLVGGWMFAVVGKYCEWSFGDVTDYEGAVSNLIEDNCVVLTLDAYTNGEGEGLGFKIVALNTEYTGDDENEAMKWYGIAEGTQIVNGEWAQLVEGGSNIVLPEGAEGKAVKFTFAVDAKTLKVEWEETPAEEAEILLVAILGACNNWDMESVVPVDHAYSTEDIVDNEAVIELPAYTNGEGEGAGFKLITVTADDEMSWRAVAAGTTIVNGEWYETIITDESAPNIVLPASAEGADVTVTFNVQNKKVKFEWAAQAQVSYALRGNWNGDDNWSDIALTATEGIYTASFTVKGTDAHFGIKEVTDGEQTAWYFAEAGTKVEAEPMQQFTLVKEDGENGANLEIVPGRYNVRFYPAEGILFVSGNPGEVYTFTLLNGETKYSTPYVYAWGDEGYYAAWPGVAMEAKEDGVTFEATIATVLPLNKVIFNNGKEGEAAKQTTDLEFEGLEYNYGEEFDFDSLPELIIVGDHNGWVHANAVQPSDCEYILSRDGFTYYTPIGVKLNGEFKIIENNGSWEGIEFGIAAAPADGPARVDANSDKFTYNLVQGGKNIPAIISDNAGVELRFDYTEDGNHSVIVAKEQTTGVESVAVASDVEAVYYNLQGQRVLRPAKGQPVIVVRGTQVSKEIVR